MLLPSPQTLAGTLPRDIPPPHRHGPGVSRDCLQTPPPGLHAGTPADSLLGAGTTSSGVRRGDPRAPAPRPAAGRPRPAQADLCRLLRLPAVPTDAEELLGKETKKKSKSECPEVLGDEGAELEQETVDPVSGMLVWVFRER